jgi:hypothetical protein
MSRGSAGGFEIDKNDVFVKHVGRKVQRVRNYGWRILMQKYCLASTIFDKLGI